MPKGSHKALPLGEKVKVLSLIKTITSLAAVARIRGKNESSFVKLWRKNRNFTLVLLTRFRLQTLREDGNGLTTARVEPPPGHLSDEGSTRRQGTPSLCDDRPGPGNEATPANAGEKRRRGGRPGLRLLEHPGAGGRAPRPGAISPQLPLPQRAWLPLSSRGARSTAQTRSQGCGGRVCSAAVRAGVSSPFGCRRGRTAGGRGDSAGCADTTLFRQRPPVPHPRRELRRAPTSPVSPAFAIPRR